jgi:hypothetical protein
MAMQPDESVDLLRLLGLRRVLADNLEHLDLGHREQYMGLLYVADRVDRWETASVSASYASVSTLNAGVIVHQLADLADQEGAQDLAGIADLVIPGGRPDTLIGDPRFQHWSELQHASQIVTPASQLSRAARDIVGRLSEDELGITLASMASLPTCVEYCKQRKEPGCLADCLSRSR